MQKIDLWLLDRIESSSHWLQKRTGYNCFSQATFCIYLFALFRMLEISSNVLANRQHMAIHNFLTGLVQIITTLWILNMSMSQLNVRTAKNSFAFAPAYIFLRITFVFTTTIDLSYFLVRLDFEAGISLLGGIVISLSIYLIACTPLPPCDGKIGEWLKSLSFRKIATEGA